MLLCEPVAPCRLVPVTPCPLRGVPGVEPGDVPELWEGCVLFPGEGTAFGATARLFMVPSVGPARLGDVAEGVPLELVPEEPEEPPLVCPITGEAAIKAITEMAKAVGVREFMKSPIRFEDELHVVCYVPFRISGIGNTTG